MFGQLRSVLAEASPSLHLVEVSPVLSELQARTLTGSRGLEAGGELVYRCGETAAGLPVSWYRRLDDVPTGTLMILLRTAGGLQVRSTHIFSLPRIQRFPRSRVL